MVKFSSAGIMRVPTRKFNREVKMEETNQDGEVVKETLKGAGLKSELAAIPKEKGRLVSKGEMKNELKERGVEGQQWKRREEIMETLEEHFEKK